MNASDNQGNTALHVAAQRSQFPIVSLLLAKGANPSLSNLQGNTPLHQSVSRPTPSSENEKEMTLKTINTLLTAVGEEILANGLPVNKQQDSILVKAVHQGNVDGAKAIIEYMCSLAAKGQISSGETLKQLLNHKNNRGLSPLHEAFIWAKIDIIQYLLQCEYQSLKLFDTKETDLEGNTVLHMAGDRRLSGISSPSSLDHITTLLKSDDFAVNAQNKNGDTVLHIPHLSVEFVDLILQHGSDVTIRNNAGDLALTVQIRGGRSYVVDRILQHMVTSKIDMDALQTDLLNAADSAGQNIAHLLASIDSDNFAMLPVTLSDRPTQEGLLPIHVAIEEKAIKALTALVKTAQAQDVMENIRASRDAYGNSLLHQMVQQDYVDGVLALLDHAKCDVNTTNDDMDEFTDGGLPIHIAALSGAVNSLPILIKHGADINSQANPTKDTPLHLAVRFNKFESVQILLENGASTEIKNRDEQTAVEEIRSLRGLDDRLRKLLLPDQ